jgi:hypothetical protein
MFYRRGEVQGRKQGLLFCKKEAKNSCLFGVRVAATLEPNLPEFFGSFLQKRTAFVIV